MGTAPAPTNIFPPLDTSVVYVATAFVAQRRPVLANPDTHATIVETCRTMRYGDDQYYCWLHEDADFADEVPGIDRSVFVDSIVSAGVKG